jgi:hypothetical protein
MSLAFFGSSKGQLLFALRGSAGTVIWCRCATIEEDMSFQDKEAEFCLLLTRMQNEPEDWRRCAPSRRSRGAFRTDMRTPRHAAREAGARSHFDPAQQSRASLRGHASFLIHRVGSGLSNRRSLARARPFKPCPRAVARAHCDCPVVSLSSPQLLILRRSCTAMRVMMGALASKATPIAEIKRWVFDARAVKVGWCFAAMQTEL